MDKKIDLTDFSKIKFRWLLLFEIAVSLLLIIVMVLCIGLFKIKPDIDLFSNILMVIIYLTAFLWIYLSFKKAGIKISEIFKNKGLVDIKDILIITFSCVLFSIGGFFLLVVLLNYTVPSFLGVFIKYSLIIPDNDILSRTLLYLSIICLAPVIEEIIFRYILFHKISRKYGIWPGIMITSLIFCVLHGVTFIMIFIFAVSFSFLYYRTKTLLWPVIFHSIYNTIISFIISPLIAHFYQISYQNDYINRIIKLAPELLVPGIVIFIMSLPGLIYFFKKYWPVVPVNYQLQE